MNLLNRFINSQFSDYQKKNLQYLASFFAATGFIHLPSSLPLPNRPLSLYSSLTLIASRSLLFDYDVGVMTDVIGSHNFLKYFNAVNTSPIIGVINSTSNGDTVFGSLMGGFTMDSFGRKIYPD